MLLGVDTGGTFTDFVLADAHGLHFHKELSTPDDPFQAIHRGIEALGVAPEALHLVHGSTVATNAILERKGARVLFVTNQGFEDLLAIGRQTRADLYNLCPARAERWIAATDCAGLPARVDADGRIVQDCPDEDLEQLAERAAPYDAVAVCLLFSFLNAEHEQRLAERLPGHLFASLSHRILPEYREFERASTTFLNAYVGPLVQRYLQRISQRIAPRQFFVMHSAGGVMDAAQAGDQAVRLVLSGPAGGLVAARHVGEMTGMSRILSFDMGGTSTDVAMLEGHAGMMTGGEIAGMPVAVPMMDIHTIGAGGGSLAWIDDAGLPRLGPESAGARPGPACYGLGGTQATVTDANLVLGHIPADARLAGRMPLHRELALAACAQFGAPLGMNAEQAASAIIALANEHMLGALRVVSVQRGIDPADLALFCFGGAGGLHACALAEALGMQRIVLPLASGAFSALGMIVGKRQADLSQSRRIRLTDQRQAGAELEMIFTELEQRARQQLPDLSLQCSRSVDVRYAGQGFHLSLPYDDIASLQQHFHQAHRQYYGHTLSQPVEVMTARLRAIADTPVLQWRPLAPQSGELSVSGTSEIYAIGQVSHYCREAMGAGAHLSGPALILEDTSTFWLHAGWHVRVDDYGHLIAEREAAS